MSSASTLAEEVLDDLDLVRHLRAAEHRHERPLRARRAPPRYFSSSSIRKPGGRLRQRASPCPRSTRARGGSSRTRRSRRRRRVPPAAARTPGRSSPLPCGSGGSRAATRLSPCARAAAMAVAAGSPTQSSANAHRPAEQLPPGASATGFRLNSGLGPPLGRPRCDARITVAPCSSAYLIVGSDARTRVSSLIAPVLDRDVEVDADEDALAREIEIADGQLRHGRTSVQTRAGSR